MAFAHDSSLAEKILPAEGALAILQRAAEQKGKSGSWEAVGKSVSWEKYRDLKSKRLLVEGEDFAEPLIKHNKKITRKHFVRVQLV